MAGWVEAHKALKPGNAELQAALDEWMEEWEEEEARRRAAALAAQEDDGWTVVQRHKVGAGWLGAGGAAEEVGGCRAVGRAECSGYKTRRYGPQPLTSPLSALLLTPTHPPTYQPAGPQDEHERQRRDGGRCGGRCSGGAAAGEVQEGCGPC